MATKRFGYLDDLSLKNQKVGIGTSTANEKLEVLGGTRGGGAVVTGIATLTSYEGFQNKKTSYVENISINSGESGTLSGEIVIGAGTTMIVGTGATTGQGSIKSLKVSNIFNPPIGGINDRPTAPQPGALYYNKDFRTIDGEESGTLSGEIVVGSGLTMTIGTGATPGQGSIKSLKVSNTFTPPIGGINDRPSAPQPGTLFYNKDFKTIEYWDGNFWRQVDNTTTSGRGVWGGGATPTYQTMQDYVTISSLGNAQWFGDLTVARGFLRGVASSVRGVTGGGEGVAPNAARTDTMEYFTIQSEGNAIDFGNLTAARGMLGSTSSSTRGVWGGGEENNPTGNVNKIEFIEISTLGNAVDLGDLTVTRKSLHNGLVNSPTRGIFAGGSTPDKVIDVITIASKANSTKFGDLSVARKGLAGCSNSTRGVFVCGEAHGSPGTVNTIDYITIASTGDAVDFGDAMSTRYIINGGVSNETRGVWSGGATALNLIEYINFSTLGDAMDFGELALGRRGASGISNSHGGLGGF